MTQNNKNNKIIKLIVGLGNPGPQYEETRHNVGFWFIDKLISQNNITTKLDKKFASITGKFTNNITNQEVHILMPQEYMNLSGKAVQVFSNYYKIKPDEILVAHDDLDHPAGIVRIKQNGGSAGHNGLRDIINKLGTQNFNRLRIGIGHPRDTNNKQEVHNYVLNKPNNAEKNQILDSIDLAYTQIDNIIAGKMQDAMLNLHQK